MDETLASEIEGLRKLRTKAFRARFEELFGEESRSSNHAHLFRRIAWRLQPNAEGDLSEHESVPWNWPKMLLRTSLQKRGRHSKSADVTHSMYSVKPRTSLRAATQVAQGLRFRTRSDVRAAIGRHSAAGDAFEWLD